VNRELEIEAAAARPGASVVDVTGEGLLATIEVDGSYALAGLQQRNRDMQSYGGFTGTTLFVAYNNDMRGTRLALICLHQHRLTPVLATAANALDQVVERRVLAIDRIVRIHQVFLPTIMVTGSSTTRCGKPHVLFRSLSVAQLGVFRLPGCER
jgi:hypothetical protein